MRCASGNICSYGMGRNDGKSVRLIIRRFVIIKSAPMRISSDALRFGFFLLLTLSEKERKNVTAAGIICPPKRVICLKHQTEIVERNQKECVSSRSSRHCGWSFNFFSLHKSVPSPNRTMYKGESVQQKNTLAATKLKYIYRFE